MGILEILVGANPEAFRDGPHRAAVMEQSGRFSDWGDLLTAVTDIGDHATQLTRAFTNQEIGLVTDLQLVEPGAARTGKRVEPEITPERDV